MHIWESKVFETSYTFLWSFNCAINYFSASSSSLPSGSWNYGMVISCWVFIPSYHHSVILYVKFIKIYWSVVQKTFCIQDNSRHEINREVDAFAENFLSTLPNCSLVKNLERLHMKSISCSPNDMHFIKHVLLYARNLQMASVEKFKGNRNSALDASRMLKEFERVSPAARICFQHRDSCWLV